MEEEKARRADLLNMCKGKGDGLNDGVQMVG